MIIGNPVFKCETHTRNTQLIPLLMIATDDGDSQLERLPEQLAEQMPQRFAESLAMLRQTMTISRLPKSWMVPLEGLEPPRPCEQQILSLSRLPFRHRGLAAQGRAKFL
jgi:hypothetical protein